MVWIVDAYFTEKWIERAERGDVPIDNIDRFISLWIAFNSWMKGKFGENKTDRYLIDKVKKCKGIEDVFEELRGKEESFRGSLDKLSGYTVEDMRYLGNKSKSRRYDGSFGSLIEVIYMIRCNLVHGRKDPEREEKDRKLIDLAHHILLPLLKNYLRALK